MTQKSETKIINAHELARHLAAGWSIVTEYPNQRYLVEFTNEKD